MNEFQTKLYNDLIKLTETNEAFFSKVQPLDNTLYRVFNYRLAGYSDWLLPGARQARGILFEIDKDFNPIRLACFMPDKFFNLNENPLTMNLDLSDDNIDGVMDKMDGSIISTFIHEDKLMVKSKTSLTSEHVRYARNYWTTNPVLLNALDCFTRMGYAVHMELTSPELRIVLGYPENKLTILSARCNATGRMIRKQDLSEFFYGDIKWVGDALADNWVKELGQMQFATKNPFADDDTKHERVAGYMDPNKVSKFIDSIKEMTGVEGYIVRLKNGEHIKIKCDWYCALHHTKDSVSAPRRLFECIINEASDDLKAMFSDDPITMDRIISMENKVHKQYNHIVKTVEDFYTVNKDLDRKSYAIKAQGIDDGLMGLKMSKFLGREVDFKSYALKNPQVFGINSTEVYETVEE